MTRCQVISLVAAAACVVSVVPRRAVAQPNATVAAPALSVAQNGQPSFDVASIRQNKSADANSGSSREPSGQIKIYNTTLREMIRQAYDVKRYQVTGGPGWVDSDRFDVTAKAEGTSRQDRLRLMMQTLLADRFGLVLHRERKELPAYVLAVTRTAPALQKAQGGNSSFSILPAQGRIRAVGTSMAQLADGLSRLLDRPVVDRSGITGSYDFQLEYAPLSPAGDPSIAQGASSIFSALSELGLKLEATTMPLEIIVVDRAVPPTEN